MDDKDVPDLLEALRAPKEERAELLYAIVADAEDARSRDLWKWDRDRAFVAGDQDGKISHTGYARTYKWERSPRVREEVRRWKRTVNHIGKISAQIRALLTQERPAFDAMAGSSEGADSATARSVKFVLQWMRRRHDLETKQANCSQGAHDVGTRFLHVTFDKTAGGLVEKEDGFDEIPEVTEPTLDPVTGEHFDEVVEAARVEPKYTMAPSGDVSFIEREPEEIVYPAYANPFRDPEWICVKEYLPLSTVQDRYGDLDFDVGHDDREPSIGSFGLSNMPGVGRNSVFDHEKLCLIYIMYVKRSSAFPLGREIVFQKELLIEEGENPVYPLDGEPQAWFPNHNFPVFPFRWIVDPKSPYGISGTSQLIDLQLDVNGFVSKQAMIAAKISHARRKVPRGTPFIQSDDPMATIEYPQTKGPDSIRWEDPPQFPHELILLPNDRIEQMNDVSGVTAAIQGQANAEDSGIKVRQLKQSAQGRLGPIKVAHDQAMARALLHAVNLLRRHLDTEQVMLVVGENNRTAVETFKQANLASMIDIYPVNNPLSSDPTSKMLQMQQLVQMLGQTQDPVLQSRIVAALNLDEVLQLQDEMGVHRDRALSEELRIARGEQVAVDPFDDDLSHIAVHTTERLSEEGQASDPQVQQMREMHIQQHMQQMAQKMGSQQPAPTQGQPSQAGSPTQPQPQPDRASAAAPQPAVA